MSQEILVLPTPLIDLEVVPEEGLDHIVHHLINWLYVVILET